MTPPRRCPHALRLEHCPTCSTRALLAELQTTVDHLAANLLPGTTRPWRAPQVSAERRAELDAQAREDRLHIAQQGDLPAYLRDQGVVVPPGESPAPYDLDIADLLSSVLADADTLGDRVAVAVSTSPPPAASSSFADPRRHLDFLIEHAETLARVDRDLLEEIAAQARTLVDRAAPALGLLMDGQLLDGTCPWCAGATSRKPAGGDQTLRIRIGEPEDNPHAAEPGQDPKLPGRPLIVCESGRCEPGGNSGQRWRGLPAWDLLNEGEWLRACIDVRDAAAECRCGRPVLRTGRAGRPAAHCSEDCRRAADAERQRNARAAS